MDLAVFWGKREVVKLLLESGADVHAKDKAGDTPLHRASSEEEVKLLLEKGADIQVLNKNGDTPLHDIAQRGNSQAINLLLEKHANIHTKNNAGDTVLHSAAQNYRDSKAILKLLLAKGMNIHTENAMGDTPLHIAAHRGNYEAVQFLLENGANAQAKNKEGDTPLHKAASNSSDDQIVKILVEKGADINAKNNVGKTPLHLAVARFYMAAMTESLISNGADIHLKDNDGNTALHGAAKKDHYYPHLYVLLSKGGNINAKNKNNQTCIDVAKAANAQYSILFFETYQILQSSDLKRAAQVLETVFSSQNQILEQTSNLESKGQSKNTFKNLEKANRAGNFLLFMIRLTSHFKKLSLLTTQQMRSPISYWINWVNHVENFWNLNFLHDYYLKLSKDLVLWGNTDLIDYLYQANPNLFTNHNPLGNSHLASSPAFGNHVFSVPQVTNLLHLINRFQDQLQKSQSPILYLRKTLFESTNVLCHLFRYMKANKDVFKASLEIKFDDHALSISQLIQLADLLDIIAVNEKLSSISFADFIAQVHAEIGKLIDQGDSEKLKQCLEKLDRILSQDQYNQLLNQAIEKNNYQCLDILTAHAMKTGQLGIISLAELQQQVLHDLNPLRHSDNNNLPSSRKTDELTEKELFNKALEDSKKTYEQLLQTTVEDFTQTIAQDKLVLEQRLLEDEKQQQTLQQQIQKLETELQKHVQDEQVTSDAMQKRLKIQKRHLRELKIKQRILWKEHQIKVKQKEMLEKFKQSPNLWLFYRTIQVCIQQLFISSSAGSGGKVTVESGSAADKTQQGLEFFGDLCNVVPLLGPAVNFILKWGIGKPVEKIDDIRQENSAKNISSLLTLTELKEMSESVAQKLTLWYKPVLQELATLDKEGELRQEKKKTLKGKVIEGAKEIKEELQEAVLKEKHKPSAHKAAEFAITWALDELEDYQPDLNNPIDDQLVWIVITKKPAYKSDKTFSLIRKTQKIADAAATNLSKALGKETVITKDGEIWYLWEMYTGCGIQTETEIYGGNEASRYGYCNGIENEIAAGVAKARGLPSQGENKKYQSKEESSKNSATSPSHHRQVENLGAETKHLKTELDKTQMTTQITIEVIKKKNSELKVKVGELEQELKEQKLQHQKEMEQMKKLIEGIQNQIQTRPSQEEPKSTSTTPFWDGTGHGNVSSQFQQTPQNPQSSSSQSQSKR